MGNIIVSGDFVDLGTITSRTEVAEYPDDNVEDYWHLRRRFRADDVTKDDWLLKFDFGAATVVEGVVLNAINFDKVVIEGNAADAWGGPAYTSATFDVTLDERVNRHKIYIPITGFNLQWMRIFIDNTTAATGDYQTKWEVGSVIVLGSATELTKNMAWGYKRKAEKPYEDVSLPHGGTERVNLGDSYQWLGSAIFGKRTETNESELWAFNLIDLSDPMIFYENDNVDNKVYLCLRDEAYEGTLEFNDLVIGNTIRFKELV